MEKQQQLYKQANDKYDHFNAWEKKEHDRNKLKSFFRPRLEDTSDVVSFKKISFYFILLY
jgi:hypothetical protein